MFVILHRVTFLIITTPCDKHNVIIPISHTGRPRLKAVRSLAHVTQLIACEAGPGCFLLLKAVTPLSRHLSTAVCRALGHIQAPLPHCEKPTLDVASEDSLPEKPPLSPPSGLPQHLLSPQHSLTHAAEGVRWVGDREYWTFTTPCKPLANQGCMI